jgi:adenylyl-sulfate kinase
LEQRLLDMGIAVQILDGDEVRKGLSKGLGFTRADREEHLRRLALLARFLTDSGLLTVTATISPYRSVRGAARRTLPRFVEVYVKCPLEVCMQRDVKGLYRKALAGEIGCFTGVSDPFEEPDSPEIVVRTDRESVAECVNRIMTYLDQNGGLTQPVDFPRLKANQAEFLQRLLDQGWSRDAERMLVSGVSSGV